MGLFGWVKFRQFLIFEGGRICVQFTFHSLRQQKRTPVGALFLLPNWGKLMPSGGATFDKPASLWYNDGKEAVSL